MARGWILLVLVSFALMDGCKSAEDRYLNYSPKETGPVVESAPTRLKSCSPKPRPQATLLPTPGAPMELRLVRAYHLCLGSHVALLRLAGAQGPVDVVQVVVAYETYDVMGRRPPRRSALVLTRSFSAKTVRFQRIEWREGRVHTDERGLRVRLAAVDFANGKRWTAPPWPPSPAVIPPAREVPGPLAPVDKLQKSLKDAARSIRKQGEKLRQGSMKVPKKLKRNPMGHTGPRKQPNIRG